MFGTLLKLVIREGSLSVLGPLGPIIIGEGHPHLVVHLHDRLALWQLCLDPDLKLGELYMDGRLTIENADIRDLLDLLMRNAARHGLHGWRKVLDGARRLGRRAMQFNTLILAKARVAHHYDLSENLYDLFLDPDKQYSCAYFTTPNQTLEEAQAAKKRHIMAKLNLDRPGLSLLDIGCGWGGLALDLARKTTARIRGVTLSEGQLRVARARALQAGLTEQVQFDLSDYRQVSGQFDRIVSVGMFEHVGLGHYHAFFAKARDLLTGDGTMLLHTIGRSEGPGVTNPWIAKYIFPGGYAPALSEIVSAIERSGLIVTDVEVLREHYALTLREWQKRFQENRARAAELYDERFCRMWEFYLAGAEMAFRYEGEVVFQIQIAKAKDSLPTTRDYMTDLERTSDRNEDVRGRAA
jgi:cyclopropane-fatty-acyl-phospholipid synthase